MRDRGMLRRADKQCSMCVCGICRSIESGTTSMLRYGKNVILYEHPSEGMYSTETHNCSSLACVVPRSLFATFVAFLTIATSGRW
jgi:hypothetical protein